MEYTDKIFCLEIWGDLACFTRPEFKVERVSYDVITPSAARAIFEAIFWKPAIRWEIVRIDVLNPIKWTSIRRNEVGALASEKSGPVYIEDKRQQKNSMMLKDVRYRIYGRMVFIPPHKRARQLEHPAGKDENPGKYHAMFIRRAENGQCFNQPYLGTRECSCYFKLIENPTTEVATPINQSIDLGFMLYDMDFSKGEKKIEPIFFRASMIDGIIEIPEPDSNKLMR